MASVSCDIYTVWRVFSIRTPPPTRFWWTSRWNGLETWLSRIGWTKSLPPTCERWNFRTNSILTNRCGIIGLSSDAQRYLWPIICLFSEVSVAFLYIYVKWWRSKKKNNRTKQIVWAPIDYYYYNYSSLRCVFLLFSPLFNFCSPCPDHLIHIIYVKRFWDQNQTLDSAFRSIVEIGGETWNQIITINDASKCIAIFVCLFTLLVAVAELDRHPMSELSERHL